MVICLVYMGCSELGRGPVGVSGMRSTTAPGSRISAKRSNSARSTQGEYGVTDSPSGNAHQPSDLSDSFNQSFSVDTTQHMATNDMVHTKMPYGGGQDLPQWENSWNPDSQFAETQFKPVNKEGARKGANHLAAHGMQMQREACKPKGQVDVVGALRPKPPPIPINRCPISFNDADCRQVIYNQKTNCWAKGDCPWNDDCQKA